MELFTILMIVIVIGLSVWFGPTIQFMEFSQELLDEIDELKEVGKL